MSASVASAAGEVVAAGATPELLLGVDILDPADVGAWPQLGMPELDRAIAAEEGAALRDPQVPAPLYRSPSPFSVGGGPDPRGPRSEGYEASWSHPFAGPWTWPGACGLTTDPRPKH
jgi:hypothetical protein